MGKCARVSGDAPTGAGRASGWAAGGAPSQVVRL